MSVRCRRTTKVGIDDIAHHVAQWNATEIRTEVERNEKSGRQKPTGGMHNVTQSKRCARERVTAHAVAGGRRTWCKSGRRGCAAGILAAGLCGRRKLADRHLAGRL